MSDYAGIYIQPAIPGIGARVGIGRYEGVVVGRGQTQWGPYLNVQFDGQQAGEWTKVRGAELLSLNLLSSWRCFHCEEVFTTREDAAAHFGEPKVRARPVCQEAADGIPVLTMEGEVVGHVAGPDLSAPRGVMGDMLVTD